jgi:ABC-type dipeptide/oligopeptide/nickel transport system permease component
MKYIFFRLLIALPTLLGVSILVFLILHFIPGDPARLVAGPEADSEDVARIRKQLGLDDSIGTQYLRFVQNAFRGDFGRSIRTKRPVLVEIQNAFPNSLELVGAGMFIAILLGLTTGVLAASKQYSAFDKGSMLVSILGISVPSFWLGLILTILLSVWLGWFPVSGRGGPFYTWQGLRHLFLPALTMGLGTAAYLSRLTRSSMLETIRADYVRTARTKGLSEGKAIYKHALANALIPIVTMVGMLTGYLIGEAVVIEIVFAWPGMGRLIVNAIWARDYPLVQAAILIISATFVVINLLVDILYCLVDPRIRLG